MYPDWGQTGSDSFSSYSTVWKECFVLVVLSAPEEAGTNGGTGNTGLKLARLLHAANIPILITSRSGTAPESFPAVKFDWNDSTFSAPFEKDPSIDKVYLIGWDIP
ncbi:hypothetical protein BDQ17DRAFT_1421793 [Cyathus striatus]|nr:hypothetical protein BDQ17DRAFT_1421793 [Cyathus striatus]